MLFSVGFFHFRDGRWQSKDLGCELQHNAIVSAARESFDLRSNAVTVKVPTNPRCGPAAPSPEPADGQMRL